MRRSHVMVRVPATSANLGPGFDTLGLSLGWYDEAEVAAVFGGAASLLSVDVSGVGADQLPRDESHLVVRALRATFAELGEQPSELRLSCRNAVPQSRGLGSSAAAIGAGVVAARALVGAEPDRGGAALQTATRLEGHPDNVAPCLLGGFTVAWVDDSGRARAAHVDVHPSIRPVVCVPPFEVSTKTARGLLPSVVPHGDAAANSARTALLVEAMSRQPHLLFDATEDRLHQAYREPAMSETIALVTALRKHGLAAVVSGAGPTVLVLADAGGDGQVEQVEALAEGWKVRALPVDRDGSVVSEIG